MVPAFKGAEVEEVAPVGRGRPYPFDSGPPRGHYPLVRTVPHELNPHFPEFLCV